jgi:hypothetical protein
METIVRLVFLWSGPIAGTALIGAAVVMGFIVIFPREFQALVNGITEQAQQDHRHPRV